MSNKPQTKRRVSLSSIAGIYLKALLKRPWLLSVLILSAISLQVADLWAPLYLRRIFNVLGAGSPGPTTLSILTGLLISLALLYFASWLSRRINTLVIVVLESNTMTDLFSVAFDYLIAHSQQFFSNQFTGTLTRRVSKFAYAFEALLDSVMLQFFPTALFVVGAVVVLYFRNHTLGLVLGIWALGMVMLQIWLARLRQPLREARSEEDSKVSGTIADALGNQTTIILFSGITFELARFREAIQRWHKATMRSWMGDEYIWAILGFFMFTIEIILLWLAINFWQRGLITIGDFILMQSYLFTVFDRVVSINRDLRRFYSALADASEMVEILEEPHGVADVPHAAELMVKDGTVDFSQVDFGFHDDLSVLNDYNLSIPGGQKVALVGPSGAGKSTITKLLLRFYDTVSGAVSIDGQDIKSVTQESLRHAIGYVPQEPILFHRTLMENIRYGRRDATDEEVIEAAKKAHAHEFISGFAQGYETYVGERGVKLSGGERQRVAIARAILKNAPILVLDEATSSLDSESEHLIQEALDTLMEGKTVIVIAHRLSTIMKMDRIVVMEQGQIVAQGTHDELLREDGLYKKLWSIQAGGFLGGEEAKTSADEVEIEADTA
jgi:ATP-binding cassette subfamily B protein